MRKEIIGMLAILILVIAGCSTQPPAPQQGPTEVKIGFVGPLTGSLASLGNPIRDAVVLAEKEINEQNLIPDKELKIIYEDDACEPKPSTNAVQKLMETDKVVAIIGPACSSPVLAITPITEQNKLLVISYAATNPAIKSAGEYVFRNVPSDAGQGVEGANIINALGAQKVGIIQLNNDWGVGLKEVFTKRAEELNITVIDVEVYEPSATDFRSQLTKIKGENPDAIYVLSFTQETGLILKQIRELGLDVPLVGADASKADEVIDTAKEAAEGFIVTLPAVPETPKAKAFAEKYKAEYGKDTSAYTAEAYDATMILAKACAATDCSSTAMKDYLYIMGEYEGASGTYSFDKYGEVEKSYDFFKVKDGKWVPYSLEE